MSREMTRREAVRLLGTLAPMVAASCGMLAQRKRLHLEDKGTIVSSGYPKRISPREALDFYLHGSDRNGRLIVVAANWRTDPEPGEEDWFEELTADEFEDEDFLEDFAEADLQILMV